MYDLGQGWKEIVCIFIKFIFKNIILCFLRLIILWSVFLFIVLYCSSVIFFCILGSMFSSPLFWPIFYLLVLGFYNFCSSALQKMISRIGPYIRIFKMAVLCFSCFLLQSSVDWFGKSVATFTQWPPPGRTIGIISNINIVF
jgi:hypothetical protein